MKNGDKGEMAKQDRETETKRRHGGKGETAKRGNGEARQRIEEESQVA